MDKIIPRSRDELKFIKWLIVGVVIIAVAFVLSMGITIIIDDYRKMIETKAAMENGYEQVQEGWGGPTLWKKIEKESK